MTYKNNKKDNSRKGGHRKRLGIGGYNHGKAERDFELNKAAENKFFRESGATEEQIKAIYEFDRVVFNSDRRFLSYNDSESLHRNVFNDNVSNHSIYERIKNWPLRDVLPLIQDAALLQLISECSEDEFELLSLLYAGVKKNEAAKRINLTHHQYVSRILNRLKKRYTYLKEKENKK